MPLERTASQPYRAYEPPGLRAQTVILAVPALCVLVLYARTVGFGLVFDDLSLIGADGPAWLGGSWLPYRPLRYASYLVDHALFGGSPAAYHFANVLLHAGAASLVALLARRLGMSVIAAVLGASVFALHPLCVEATAYVAGRRDLLAGVLVVLAAWLWVGPQRRGGAMFPALAIALAACAAKESGIVAFGLLAAASAAGLGPRPRDAVLPIVATAACSIALMFAYGAAGPWLPSGGLAQWVGVAGALCTHYLGNLVLPTDLAVSYPSLICQGVGCTPAMIGGGRIGALLLAGVFALASFLIVRARTEKRAGVSRSAFVVAGFGVVLVALVVFIGRHEPGADRHAYPLVAFFTLALADFADRLLYGACEPRSTGRRDRSSARGAKTGRALRAFALRPLWVLVPMAVLIAITVRLSDARLRVWRDERTLWSTTIAQRPDSARAHYNLAVVLLEDGERSKARAQLRRAVALDPGHVPAHLARAVLECGAGHGVRARRSLDLALDAGADWREVGAIEAECEPLGGPS